MPELAVVVGRVGDIFAVQDATMDADDEHLLVVGPVENAEPPPFRQIPLGAPEEVVLQFGGTRAR